MAGGYCSMSLNVTVRFLLFDCIVFALIGRISSDTRCEAPSVAAGQSANITCFFSVDVSKTRQDFAVQKSVAGEPVQDILRCTWLDGDRPVCTIHQGYEYDGNVADTLHVHITSATDKNVGRYVCQVVPSELPDLQPCSFELIDQTQKTTDTATDSSVVDKNGNNTTETTNGVTKDIGVIIAAAVAGLFTVIIVCIVVFVIMRKRHRQRGNNNRAPKGPDDPKEVISLLDIQSAHHSKVAHDEPIEQLLRACKTGDVKVVSGILGSKKASVNCTGVKGQTPLHVACQHGQAMVVNQLLSFGASVAATDENGWTPLHWASYSCSAEVVKLLLKSGAKIKSVDKNKSTALHLACGNTEQNSEDIQVVPKKSKKVKTKGKGKARKVTKPTAAEITTQNESATVWELLMNGAQVGAEDSNKRTPLHLACLYGKETIVRTMFGDNFTQEVKDSIWSVINVRDKEKRTPLHLAYQGGNEQIVEMLIKKGAMTGAIDKNSLTPEKLGPTSGHEDIAVVPVSKETQKNAEETTKV